MLWKTKIVIGTLLLALPATFLLLLRKPFEETPTPIPFTQSSQQQPPLVLEETRSEINITSTQLFETTNLNVYRNQNIGVVFKYPDHLKVVESYSLDVGERIILIPTNNVDVRPVMAIWGTCLIPDNVPKESWENNFLQPGWDFSGHPIEYRSSELLKSYEVGTRKLFVFYQGCYECYDGESGPHPEKERDGFSAFSCKVGLNKNGNEAAQCLAILTERQKIGSPELEKLKKFFLDDFIPTLEILQGFMLQDCEGIGESVG